MISRNYSRARQRCWLAKDWTTGVQIPTIVQATLFHIISTSALELTQPHIKWVPGTPMGVNSAEAWRLLLFCAWRFASTLHIHLPDAMHRHRCNLLTESVALIDVPGFPGMNSQLSCTHWLSNLNSIWRCPGKERQTTDPCDLKNIGR